MKKSIFTLLVLGLLCTLPMRAQERIMLFADPHVYPQALIEADPDFDTYMEGQRKMVDLSEPIWHALMDTAKKYQPSLVLIPGDLTRDGEAESHELVSQSLNELQELGIRTLVIPGNHDLPGANWETLYPGTYQDAVRDEDSHTYAVEPLPGLTVIGIDGTDGKAGIGKMSKKTLAFVLAQADSANAKGNSIIAMCHWQILEHFDKQGTLESSCRMKEADALRDSLMHHGVHLVLTGHFHVNGITTFRDTTGLTQDSLVEITTGSPITYPCPYRWLTFAKNQADIAVSTDYITSLENIPDMYTYSRDWMTEHAQNMLPALTLRAWAKAESMTDKMADYLPDRVVSIVKACLPTDDDTKIALTEKYFGSTVIELYLFHSDANENERPALGDSLAQEVYKGMDGMMHELTDEMMDNGFMRSFQELLINTAMDVAEEPVQSLVEDITGRKSNYPDRTDDLRPTLRIGTPKEVEAIPELIPEDTNCRKRLVNGQLLIERNGVIYNAEGKRIR